MGLKLQSSSGGSVELVVPVTASAFTATVPAQNCTLGIQGPAFSAYTGSNQSLASQTFTKLQMNTKLFDTNSNFDTTTYRFTPTVAGYYQFTVGLQANVIGTNIYIYKNGNPLKSSSNGAGGTVLVAGLLYMNGSTDYVELYAYLNSAGTVTGANSPWTFFDGALVRAA